MGEFLNFLKILQIFGGWFKFITITYPILPAIVVMDYRSTNGWFSLPGFEEVIFIAWIAAWFYLRHLQKQKDAAAVPVVKIENSNMNTVRINNIEKIFSPVKKTQK